MTLKKPDRGDLIMKIHREGGKAKPPGEEIVNKLKNVDVTIMNEETTFSIFDLDATITKNDILEAVEKKQE